MKTKAYISLIACFVLFAAASMSRAETDPYEILSRHIEAMGGIEKLDSLRSHYIEGTIVIEGTGLEGTFKEWQIFPERKRTEVDLTVITQVSGDNGEFAWGVDPNGKLKIAKDKATEERREIAKLMNLNDHADPQSEVFGVVYRGEERFNEYNCYLIKISNNINSDSLIRYFDKDSLMIRRELAFTPEGESETIFADYRETDGVPAAYQQKSIDKTSGMVQNVEVTQIAYKIQVDPGIFDPPKEDVRDFEFTEGDRAENISFVYFGEHIFLEVNMGCRHSLWILDTGAGMTVIDSSFAAKIGLEMEASMTGQGAGSLVQVYFVSLPEFSVEGLNFAGQKAIAIDLKDIMKKSGLEFDGILGYDFLSRLTTRIDYANELISFYDPETFVYDGPGVVVDAPIKDQTFELPAVIDGKYKGMWSLDTGAGSCNFQYPFAKENGLLERDGIEFVGTGAGGTFVEKISRFESFELAGFVIEKPTIDLTLAGESGSFQKADAVGNLGNTVMRHFVMFLDYKNQQVIFEKGDNFNGDFPQDKSGLQLMESDNGGFEIYHVAERTAGAAAGFKAKDIIIAVNGIEVIYLDGLGGMKELLKQDEGTEYIMTVKRGNATKEIKLKLKRYI